MTLAFSDQALADRVRAMAGDESLREKEVAAVLPLVGAVLVGSLTAAAFAQIANWILRNDECQQIMDFRGDEIDVKVNCEIRNGRIIVVAKEGETVEISDVPDLIDFTEIAKTAITEGAAAAKAAVEAAGGTAEVGSADPELDSPT